MSDIQTALDRIPCPVGVVLQPPEVITVSWFTQISRTPPLIALSIAPQTSVTPSLAAKKKFTLAILRGDQETVARTCGHHQTREPDKIKAAGLEIVNSEALTTPWIKNALLNLECKVIEENLHGDHVLYVAEVTGAVASEQKHRPLVFVDRDLISL